MPHFVGICGKTRVGDKVLGKLVFPRVVRLTRIVLDHPILVLPPLSQSESHCLTSSGLEAGGEVVGVKACVRGGCHVFLLPPYLLRDLRATIIQ